MSIQGQYDQDEIWGIDLQPDQKLAKKVNKEHVKIELDWDRKLSPFRVQFPGNENTRAETTRRRGDQGFSVYSWFLGRDDEGSGCRDYEDEEFQCPVQGF